MPMAAKERVIRKRVKALVDAKPTAVSLVKAGANKTPFRVLKDDGAVPVSALPSSVTDGTYGIGYIHFDTASFDEPKVEAWLKDGGYEDYRIQKNEDENVWEVISEGEDKDTLVKSLKGRVTLSDGIYVFLVEQDRSQKDEETGGDEKKAPVQPVAISMEVASKKFDSYSAQSGWSGKTLKEVLENSSWDGLPLGIFDLTQALYGAVKSNFRDGNIDGIGSVVDEYKAKLTALAGLFPHPKLPDDLGLALKGDASIPDYDRTALVDRLAPDFAPVQKGDAAMAKDTKDAAAEAEAKKPVIEGEAKTEAGDEQSQKAAFKNCDGCKTPDACTKGGACGADKAAKKDENAAEGEGKTPDAEGAKNEAEGADAQAKKTEGSDANSGSEDASMPAWARALFEPLAKSVGDLAETVKTGFAQAAQKADALEQRVTSVEEGSGSRQTRKGADVDDATGGSPEDAERKKKADEFDAWNKRGMLGIRNQSI